MATRFSSAIVPSNGTDANFRAWVQFIEDTLVTTGGWVVTADTGQMTIATASRPTVADTKAGYRIYRMNDALQATAPVFVRIDYGNDNIDFPGMWFTIGQGSDGAGNITNIRYDGGALAVPQVSTGAASILAGHNSYGSADPNRFSFGMFIQATAARCMSFFLERTHDATGADTVDGLIFGGSLNGVNITFSMVVMLSIPQPPADTGLNILLPSANPGTFGADVGVGVHIPFAGIALYPAKGVVVVRQADFAANAGFSMTMYGSTITYQQLHPMTAKFPNGSTASDANARLCIRYD